MRYPIMIAKYFKFYSDDSIKKSKSCQKKERSLNKSALASRSAKNTRYAKQTNNTLSLFEPSIPIKSPFTRSIRKVVS